MARSSGRFPSYPLRFAGVNVPRMWGGKSLGAPIGGIPVGERWILSNMPGAESRVMNGEWAGRSFPELCALFPEELLGPELSRRNGSQYPLLIKLIDAAIPLSIQVHPSDRVARELGLSCGKSEMWYVLEAQPGAHILLGLREDIGRDELELAIRMGQLEARLQRVAPRAGDCFHIPAGQIHAIGGGLLLLEVQQPSDATFRLYDWDRTDQLGQKRTLHPVEGAEAACLRRYEPPAQPVAMGLGCEVVPLVVDSHFTVSRLHLGTGQSYEMHPLEGHPYCIIPTGAGAWLRGGSGAPERLPPREVTFIPAGMGAVRLESERGEDLLLAYV